MIYKSALLSVLCPISANANVFVLCTSGSCYRCYSYLNVFLSLHCINIHKGFSFVLM